MTEMEEETVEVLYNTHYGGFGVSEKAEELYRKYKKEKDPQTEFDPFEFSFIGRTNPIWIRIFHELGNEFNGPYCNAAIAIIPKKYKHHYIIDEYDGKERIEIDHLGYGLSQIKTILHSEETNDEKIRQLKLLKILSYKGL